MTTNGDMPLRQPDENELLEQLFADVLSLTDKTAARITDAEVDEHLQSVLDQAGYCTQVTDPSQYAAVRPKDEGPLTPADVRNKQFSTTRIRPGYNEEEVDAFLDEVGAALDRLIQENDELRAKLAEELRDGKSAVPAFASPLSDPKPDMMAPEHVEPERRQPEPVMLAGAPHTEDTTNTAARVLSLARQTADQAIADARREADEILGRARRETDEMLTDARRQTEQITADARARAESLERDAQERHRQAMGSLVQTREEVERRVDNLRAFEREYRSRLKAYLEGQLRDLAANVSDSGTFPTMGSAPPPALGQPRKVPGADVRPGHADTAPAGGDIRVGEGSWTAS